MCNRCDLVLVSSFDRTPMLGRKAVSFGPKNGQQIDIMCSKEVILHAQNLLTNLFSLVNITTGGGG